MFPAGMSEAGVAAVRPDGMAEADVSDAMISLADKSLLQPQDGGRRMRMLETIPGLRPRTTR